jgi:hypothetical protein
VRGLVDQRLRFSRVSITGTQRADDGQDGSITSQWNLSVGLSFFYVITWGHGQDWVFF